MATRKKVPQNRLAAYKAWFQMTSKGGRRYRRDTPAKYARFFRFDKAGIVVLRAAFTRATALAAIGGESTYRYRAAAVRAAAKNIDKALGREAKRAEREGEFDPNNATEGRKRVERAITLRRGQLVFRRALLVAYNRRCAVTNCDCPDALEAAHILPYDGESTHHVQNGILLRSDIHTLFDIGRIGFAPARQFVKVILSDSLKGTVYNKLSGTKLRLPSQMKDRPSQKALRQHLQKWRIGPSQAQ
jgi:hypothetical protein